MAHSVEIPYLDKENIEIYLNDLATEIEKAKIGKHSILIVGGAAMALKYEDERSTVDIDICFWEQNKLYSCCEVITKNYNLPEDWINADVMHSDSFSYKLFDNAILYKTIGDYLDIYVVDDIDLYCMKIVGLRPKDVEDMNSIAPKLKVKGVTVEDIENNFERLYGSKYHLINDEMKLMYVNMQLS